MGSFSPKATISKFESILEEVASGILDDQKYVSQRQLRSQLLQFLRPIITDLYLGDPQAYAIVKRDMQEFTSVSVQGIIEEILYYGLLTFYTFYSNKARHLYQKISLAEVYEEWHSHALYPDKALKKLSFYRVVDRRVTQRFFSQLYLVEIKPHIRNHRKARKAIQYFRSIYLSGVLLGQTADIFVLKHYFEQKDSG